MKRIAQTMTTCIVILFSIASCDKKEKETGGGQKTISVLNYKSWWFSYEYESASYINGSWEYINDASTPRNATIEM